MRHAILFLSVSVLGMAGPLTSAETTNPYEAIASRNPFGIKDPPPPPPPKDNTPPVALPKVILTGIESMFGPPRALLEVTENEPGKAANVKRPILRQGEKEGNIEVVSIDVANNSVMVKNGGFQTNLNFEVPKSTPAPAAANMTAAPLPGTIPHLPGQVAPATPAAPSYPGMPSAAAGVHNENLGRPGSGVTTYGASSPGDKPLPLRQPRTDASGAQSTLTGADLLRESARARGLPVPPLPGATR